MPTSSGAAAPPAAITPGAGAAVIMAVFFAVGIELSIFVETPG
jgi:hypothetical protein